MVGVKYICFYISYFFQLLAAVSRSSTKQTSQLPITRVKNIIKSDPDITLASQEATLIISKVQKVIFTLQLNYLFVQATELFVRHLSRQSHVFTMRGKRKTIQRRDVIACLPQHDEFAFLEGAIDS